MGERRVDDPAYLAELDQLAAEVRDVRAWFTIDLDDVDEPLATCDLCRLDWPVDDLESVVWTDSQGEEWDRRFCSICCQKEGM